VNYRRYQLQQVEVGVGVLLGFVTNIQRKEALLQTCRATIIYQRDSTNSGCHKEFIKDVRKMD
jgi:hypothetical protein